MTDSDLVFRSAVELAGLIRAGDLSACEVMEAHLRRIEAVNPAVNAIITLTADTALAQARAADERQARGEPLPVLHGLPVAHKDLEETAGIRTTFGSPIFRDYIPPTSSLVVERLQAAGAITIGKTNTPEFGAGSQTFNPVFGATKNPYDLTRTCGGSSGGAAAALAAGMIPLADGSDMGGSLRNPASFCNVAGFRPSPGRVPTWPNRMAWSPLGVNGPMARSVADLALMMQAVAGPDDRSPIGIEEPGSRFAEPLERNWRGVRIAWSAGLGLPFEPDVLAVTERQRTTFESLGCIVEPDQPAMDEADRIFKGLRAWHFAVSLRDAYTSMKDQLKDTIIWNIEQGQRLTAADLGRLELDRTVLYHRVRKFLTRYDFLVLPTVQVLPFDVTVPHPTSIAGTPMETYIDWMKSCYYISTLGLPALSVPAGFSATGLPVGLQIVGRHHDDFGVLQLGHAFEAATGFGRRRPALAPTVG